MVVLDYLLKAKVLVLYSNYQFRPLSTGGQTQTHTHIQPVGWPGPEKKWVLEKCTACLCEVGFRYQSVLSILLGRGLEKESSASNIKNGKHTQMAFLVKKYKLNFRL
jgi:hypothetical protein